MAKRDSRMLRRRRVTLDTTEGDAVVDVMPMVDRWGEVVDAVVVGIRKVPRGWTSDQVRRQVRAALIDGRIRVS